MKQIIIIPTAQWSMFGKKEDSNNVEYLSQTVS